MKLVKLNVFHLYVKLYTIFIVSTRQFCPIVSKKIVYNIVITEANANEGG